MKQKKEEQDYRFDPNKPIDWEKLARLTEYWIRKYPTEAYEFSLLMKETRLLLKDPVYARSKDRRFVARVPETLDLLFIEYEPNYKSEKNIRAFLARFPMFKVPEQL